MDKMTIKIPDNLTPENELKAIFKKISQKQLSGDGSNKDIKRIGQQYDIKHTETQITIVRESKEPIIEMVTCNACNCEYQNNTAFYYWHNYGGKPKKVAVCSEKCQTDVINLLGGRASKKKIKMTRLF